MKRIVTFDAFDASAYDVLDALYPVRSIAGVKSLEVLSAVEGSPRFCIILETEDDKDAAITARFDALKAEYAGYHSNMTMRTYRKVG